MSAPLKLSVVIAVQHAEDNLDAILHSLEPAAHPDVEFLFCYTDADPATRQRIAGADNMRVLRGQVGSLIPHLWRDGIEAARGETVAITTAHCIPDRQWVDALLRLRLNGAAGIGGVIDNDPRSDAKAWAIFMQRYISYAPPRQAGEVAEIAADNAVYRRADIMEHADLLTRGFWEPSFHAHFRAAGKRLRLEPTLRVLHRNRYTATQFFAQRFAHGREFGLARAARLGMAQRFALIALAPVLPVVFLRKIVRAVRAHGAYVTRLPRAWFWLLFFLLGWGMGEARGYLASLHTAR